MKNRFYGTFITIFMISLASCAPAEECVCEFHTITESDAKDSNVTLEEACTLAQFSDPSCAIK